MFTKGTFLRTAWSHWMVSIFGVFGSEAYSRHTLNIWFSTFHQIPCFIFYECTDYCSKSQENTAKRRGDGLNSFSISQLERSFLFLTFLLFPKAFSGQPGGSHLSSPWEQIKIIVFFSYSHYYLPRWPACLSIFWDIMFSFFLSYLSGLSFSPPQVCFLYLLLNCQCSWRQCERAFSPSSSHPHPWLQSLPYIYHKDISPGQPPHELQFLHPTTYWLPPPGCPMGFSAQNVLNSFVYSTPHFHQYLLLFLPLFNPKSGNRSKPFCFRIPFFF